jgi:hypothetical protein
MNIPSEPPKEQAMVLNEENRSVGYVTPLVDSDPLRPAEIMR